MISNMRVHVAVLLAVLPNIFLAEALGPRRHLHRYLLQDHDSYSSQLTFPRPGRWDRRFLNQTSVVRTTTSLTISITTDPTLSSTLPNPITHTTDLKVHAAIPSNPFGQAGSVIAVGDGPGAGTVPESEPTSSSTGAKPTTQPRISHDAIPTEANGVSVVSIRSSAGVLQTGSVVATGISGQSSAAAAGFGAALGPLSSSLNIPLGTAGSSSNPFAITDSSTAQPAPVSSIGQPQPTVTPSSKPVTTASTFSTGITSSAAANSPKLTEASNRTASFEPHRSVAPAAQSSLISSVNSVLHTSVSIGQGSSSSSDSQTTTTGAALSSLPSGSSQTSTAAQPSSANARFNVPSDGTMSSLDQALQFQKDMSAFTAETTCSPQDPFQKGGCVNGKIGTCVNGKYNLQSCPSGEKCFPMPASGNKGITIMCATPKAAEKAGLIPSSLDSVHSSLPTPSSTASASKAATGSVLSPTQSSAVPIPTASGSSQSSQSAASESTTARAGSGNPKGSSTATDPAGSQTVVSSEGSSSSASSESTISIIPVSTTTQPTTVTTISTPSVTSTPTPSTSAVITPSSPAIPADGTTTQQSASTESSGSSAASSPSSQSSQPLSTTEPQSSPLAAGVTETPSPAASSPTQIPSNTASPVIPSSDDGGITIVPVTTAIDGSTQVKLLALATPAASELPHAAVAHADPGAFQAQAPTTTQGPVVAAVTMTGHDDRVTVRETVTVTVTAG